jgi:Ca-activated chloride channel homolog
VAHYPAAGATPVSVADWSPIVTPAAIRFAFGDERALLLLALIPIIGFMSWRVTWRSRHLRRSVLLLRMGMLGFLIVSLAEPLLSSSGAASTTVFLIDQSTSVTSNRDSSVNAWVQDALAGAGKSDNAAIVAFGGSAQLAAPTGPAAEVNPDWADALDMNGLNPSFTNLESAIALARSLPVGGNRRIVVVSDGAENLGSAQNQVAQAGRDGVPIDVVHVAGAGNDDLRIDSVTAPVAIWQGEQPNVLVGVSTVEPGNAHLDLIVDDVAVAGQDITLPVGLSSYSFTAPELSPGFHSLAVRVSGDAGLDQFSENNTAPLAMIVRSAPRVLLVAPSGSDPSRLSGALTGRGADVTNVSPEHIPVQMSALSAYDAFILDNVPASALQVEQIAGLQEATRTLGKGLIVIGGTSSFGPGQYANTRLEEMLPVTIKVTDGRERQRVALLLVVDHSGSMSYDPLQETSKIEMAKEAMRLAGDALSDGDTIGILSFSDSQDWVYPLTQIAGDVTRQEINAAVSGIKANGGTEIYPALQVGLDAIRNVDADVRHVVLLSDGKSKSGTQDAFVKLVSEAGADRTSVSTIAIGNDSDTPLLEAIAQAGGGRYHFTNRAEEIPQITLEEARSAGAQSVIRGAFQPVQTLPSPIMTGFDPALLPPLDGYDFTEIRPGAQVVLVSHRNDPVLAKWQYGLGRVVAWTPDDGADLASQWSAWEKADQFWAAMLRWTLPDPENRSVSTDVSRDGPDVVLSLNTSADRADNDYVDLSTLHARITGPGGAVTDGIALAESGAGQYQIRIRDAESGAYKLELVDENGAAREDQYGFTLPGSPELLPSHGGEELLSAIANTTNGRMLSLDDPGDVFSAPASQGDVLRTYRPIWTWTVIAALVLFLLELIVRLNGYARLRALRRVAR